MNRVLSITLALLLAAPAWAAEPPIEVPPLTDLPRDVKAGEVVKAGVWMSSEYARKIGGEHKFCLDSKKQCEMALEAKPLGPSGSDDGVKIAMLAGTIGLVIGIAVGVVLGVVLVQK